MHRKLFSGALLFTATTAVLYVGVLAALCGIHRQGRPFVHWFYPELHWKGGASWMRYTEFDSLRKEHFDAIILGSSHAYRGYDPRIFKEKGYSCFNLGSSAQTPMHTYRIMREVLDHRNTGLVIFDCYDIVMENDPLEATADLSMNVPWTRAATAMALEQRDPRGLLMLTVRALLAGEGPVYSDSTYRPGGYCEKRDSLRYPVWYRHPDAWKPREGMEKYFTRILDRCKELDIPVVLVSHPSPLTANEVKHRTFSKWVHSVADPRGVPYIDLAFHHGLPINDHDHFYDHNHLNLAGVRIFNEHLIHLLEQKGLLHPKASPQ